jgi:hypothetical protein
MQSHFARWVTPLIADLPDDFAAPSILNRFHKMVFHKLKQFKKLT